MIVNVACFAAVAASAAVFAVLDVRMRREHRRALADIARPVDGQPLSYRNQRILAAIERDTERFPVQEPAYKTGRPQ